MAPVPGKRNENVRFMPGTGALFLLFGAGG